VKTQGRQEKTVLRFSSAVVLNQLEARRAATKTVAGENLNSVEAVLTSAGVVELDGATAASDKWPVLTSSNSRSARGSNG
jgi:hypothetical protein